MYLFIVNPSAGNGYAKKVFATIQAAEIYRHINSICQFTEQIGDGEKIAKTYSKDRRITHVIVIGGDGTLHEVMNGWKQKKIPVSFIPGGSGNDFARGIRQKKKKVKDQLQKIIENPEIRFYWNGTFQADTQNEKKFINSVGIGVDAKTTEIANRSRYKKILNWFRLGKLIYISSVIQAILHFKPMDMTLIYNGRQRNISNAWMISIANHPYCGGGLEIIPHANLNSEYLSILIVHAVSKKKILLLFLLVVFGLHPFLKEVELLQVKELTIMADIPLCYQVDGETNYLQKCYLKKDKNATYIYQ